MPFRVEGSNLGLLLRHRTKAPGPGSIDRLVLPTESHTPPEALSCFITTNLAPAVPKNLTKDIVKKVKAEAKVKLEVQVKAKVEEISKPMKKIYLLISILSLNLSLNLRHFYPN
jgi:hypothetical protein